MATTVIDAFARQAWTKGSRQHEAALPVGVYKVGLLLDRTAMSGAEDPGQIGLALQYSLDGGKTWVDTGSVTTSLGDAFAPDGARRTFSGIVREIPDPRNKDRRIRAQFRMEKPATVAVELQLVS